MHISTAPAHCTARVDSRPDRVAALLLDALQLDPSDHVVLSENLAAYVTHLKPDFQEQLAEKQGDALLQSLRGGYCHGESRWTEKLLRDTGKPYSDGEVQKRFEELQARFAEEGQKLQAEHIGSYPCRMYVTGSLVKGRFGAHSDVDAIGVATVKNRPSDYGAVAWQMTDERGEDFLLKSFVEAKPVNPAAPQPLLEIYRAGLETRGLHLHTDGAGVWQIQRFENPPRQPEPKSQTGMMWSFADLP